MLLIVNREFFARVKLKIMDYYITKVIHYEYVKRKEESDNGFVYVGLGKKRC